MAWTTPRTWTTGDVMTSAVLNTHIRDDLLALYSDVGSFKTDTEGFFGFTDWQNVVFQNSWTQYPLPPSTGYKKVGSWVYVVACMQSGSVDGVHPCFTLPAGYRPSKDVMLYGCGETNLADMSKDMCEVWTDGSVVPTFGDNFFFQVAGMFSVL